MIPFATLIKSKPIKYRNLPSGAVFLPPPVPVQYATQKKKK